MKKVNKKPFVLIAIPTGGHPKFVFVSCLLRLTQRLSQKGIPWTALLAQSSILPRNRQRLMEEAIRKGASHVLWLDDDMVFPDNTVERLLLADKDVVAVNYTSKTLPAVPLSRGMDGEIIRSRGKKGLEQVLHIPLGITLMRPEVLRGVPKPWFAMPWNELRMDVIGEDWYMCEKLKDAGKEIWIDHELSNECRHEGMLMFGHNFVPPEGGGMVEFTSEDTGARELKSDQGMNG